MPDLTLWSELPLWSDLALWLDLSLWLDALLTLALVVTAAAALHSRDLFRAVVLFIAFGLLLAVVWVRLQAPDLALAEAAIGAGLAGALLLDAVSQMRDPERAPERALPVAAGGLCFGFMALLIAAVWRPPEPSPRLMNALENAMGSSGVSHEVTAVLLNFRGYDTFLEISVLAVTAFIGLALKPDAHASPPPLHQLSDPVLNALVVWLVPVMLMVATYLFWAGSKQPGGAFQAGAVLAASGVLLRLSGFSLPLAGPGPGLRVTLSMGFLAFLLAGLSGPLLGLPLFSYRPESAGAIIVAVEAFLALSIGITLLSLFSAAPPTASNDGAGR